MKKILSLLLIFLPGSAFAQSKAETEEWILSKIPGYNLGLSYLFDGEDLVSEVSPTRFRPRDKATLSIASVKTISYLHTDEFLSFAMECDDECVYSVTTDDSGKFVSDEKRNVFLLEIYDKVDASLIPRMEKALLNLVAVHGGQAKLVPHKKPKEAF